MNSKASRVTPGPPPDIEARIRSLGAVLDMAATQQIYSALSPLPPSPDIEIVRDLVYGSDERQCLDLYRAPRQRKQRPVLLVFHGGGFIRGDKRERENAGLYFANQGYLTLVPNYRLAPRHRWPAGAEDVMSALAWARANATAHGGDPHRIWLLGESAGAAHVAAATLLKRFHSPPGLGIAGAVLISGVYNVQLELLARRQFGVVSPDPRNEAYFGSDFSLYPSMSVAAHIDSDPFPILITFAELDLIGMQVQAGELFAKLVNRGFSPAIQLIRHHNHLTQVYSVNTGDESLTAPVLKFLRDRPQVRGVPK